MRGVTSCVGLLVVMYTNAVLTSWSTVHIENLQKSCDVVWHPLETQ